MIPSIQDLTERALHAPTLASVLRATGATVHWSGPVEGRSAALATLDGHMALVIEAPGGVRVHPLTPTGAPVIPLDLHGAAWDASVSALARALVDG